MIKIDISEQDIVQAESLRYDHKDSAVKRRMAVLYFKGLSFPHSEIERLAGVSSTTITVVLKLYARGGLAAIADIQRRIAQSELEQHSETVLSHLKAKPPSTSKEAQQEIERLTGLKRCRTQVRVFMHKHGFKPRKTAAIPAKANPEMQEHFKKKSWSLD